MLRMRYGSSRVIWFGPTYRCSTAGGTTTAQIIRDRKQSAGDKPTRRLQEKPASDPWHRSRGRQDERRGRPTTDDDIVGCSQKYTSAKEPPATTGECLSMTRW